MWCDSVWHGDAILICDFCEEADSEVDNDDYRDYDDLWIPSFFKEECITMDTIFDIRQFDMGKMTIEDVSRLDFCDLEIAYLFYWFFC